MRCHCRGRCIGMLGLLPQHSWFQNGKGDCRPNVRWNSRLNKCYLSTSWPIHVHRLLSLQVLERLCGITGQGVCSISERATLRSESSQMFPPSAALPFSGFEIKYVSKILDLTSSLEISPLCVHSSRARSSPFASLNENV